MIVLSNFAANLAQKEDAVTKYAYHAKNWHFETSNSYLTDTKQLPYWYQTAVCFVLFYLFNYSSSDAVVSPDGQQEVEDELREAEGEQHRGLVHGAPLPRRQLPPLEY